MVHQNCSVIKTLYLKQLYFFCILCAGFLFSCAGRESFTDDSDPRLEGETVETEAGDETGGVAALEKVPYDGKLLAQVVFDSIDYIAPRQDLLQPFIREFGNGTVVDKVMISKVQESKNDKPAYYLVGLGVYNGAFRSMALELDIASDNSLYLSSKGAKHMCEGSIGCGFCYFTFSGNKITGCECSSRGSGNNCVHKVSQGNTLLKGVQLRNTRKD